MKRLSNRTKGRADGRTRDGRRLDMLDRALDLIASSYLAHDRLSIEDLAEKVLKAAMDLTGSRHGFTARIDQRTGWVTVPAMSLPSGKTMRMKAGGHPLVFKEPSGLWGWALRNKKPMMINDVGGDPRWRGVPDWHFHVDKFLAAPAVCDRKLTGIIALANPESDYTRADLSVVKKLAIAYAVALQRKFEEDSLKENEFKYRSIITASDDIIYTAGLDGRITFVSPKVEYYGYSPSEFIGRHILEFIHPDDRYTAAKALEKLVRTDATSGNVDCRLKKKDGSYFQAEERCGVLREEGRPPMISGIIRDVSERDELRERLVKNEETLRRIFETATDAVFVKDLKGRYTRVNRACARFLHMPQERMLGKTDLQLFPKKTAEAIRATDRQVMKTGNTIFTTENILRPGDDRFLYASKTPLRDANGTIVGILGIAKDITQLKKLEAELIKAKALEAVSDVARPAAHDFNNILAAINGYAVLIMETLKAGNPVKPEIAQILKAVKRASAITDRLQTYASADPKGKSGAARGR